MKKISFILTSLIISVNCFSQENDLSAKFSSEYINGRLMKTLEDNDHMVSTSLKSISREDGKYYINENFSLGYAYDTYGADQLSGLNLKAHEIAVRFMFGTKSDTPELEEPSEN